MGKLKGWHFLLVPVGIVSVPLVIVLWNIVSIYFKVGKLEEANGIWWYLFVGLFLVWILAVNLLFLIRNIKFKKIAAVVAILIGGILMFKNISEFIDSFDFFSLNNLLGFINGLCLLLGGVWSFFEKAEVAVVEGSTNVSVVQGVPSASDAKVDVATILK